MTGVVWLALAIGLLIGLVTGHLAGVFWVLAYLVAGCSAVATTILKDDSNDQL